MECAGDLLAAAGLLHTDFVVAANSLVEWEIMVDQPHGGFSIWIVQHEASAVIHSDFCRLRTPR